MFDTAPTETEAPAAPPEETGAQGRMRLMRRMAEIGVRMAERLDRQSEIAAVWAESPASPREMQPVYMARLNDIARSFAPLSRAVSVCTALEHRIETDPPASPTAPRFTPVCSIARKSRLSERRDAVEHALRQAIERDPRSLADPARIEGLVERLWGLLDQDTAKVDALIERPFEEIVLRLCRRLDVDPALALHELDPSPPEAPSPARGRMGPVPKEREDEATEAPRQDPRPADPDPIILPRAAPTLADRQPANTPSSLSASPNGAHPSPDPGRIKATPGPGP